LDPILEQFLPNFLPLLGVEKESKNITKESLDVMEKSILSAAFSILGTWSYEILNLLTY